MVADAGRNSAAAKDKPSVQRDPWDIGYRRETLKVRIFPFPEAELLNLDSSVECLTQRRREAESAENARDLANTMNSASNLLEAKLHLKGETKNCSGHCDKITNLQFSQYSLPLCTYV